MVNFLDSMMWSIVASGVLSSIAILKLPYNPSSDSIDDDGNGSRNFSKGLAIALGAVGLYLFLTGMAINLMWPFGFSGGVYDILFGGAAAFGGLVLLTLSVSLFLNRGLQAVSYLAVVLGLFLTVDAFSIVKYQLTKDPTLSALLYLAPAAAAFLSVPATHIDNKRVRWLYAIFAAIFALAWLYFAAEVTLGHLQPPP